MKMHLEVKKGQNAIVKRDQDKNEQKSRRIVERKIV